MTLKATFLGTGDYTHTQQRNSKSLHVRRESDEFLFDVGEGTVRQMMKFNVRINIGDIFLTGARYDHSGGLPGLFKTYDSNHINRKEDVKVYTPQGTGNKIEEISHLYDDYGYDIDIREVTPGLVLEKEDYAIKAFETDSLETSVGYILHEDARRGKFDREKAEELGVPPGPKFGELVDGNPVKLGNGNVVRPDQVMGNQRPGRKIVYTGDTRPMDTTIEAASHADLLIHDSAFAENWNERAVDTGHSTALEAASVAEEASSKRLALTNVSPRFTGLGYRLRQEAESVYDDKLIVSKDGLTIDVPFPDSDEAEKIGFKSRSANSFYSVGKRSEGLRNKIEALREVAESGYLDLSESVIHDLSSALDEIVANVENSVLIVGSFDGRHQEELGNLKSELNSKGYDANTAEELPSHVDKSLRQNIAVYMMLSRFSVMVDRDPSGHLNEYEIARDQGNILARLAPEDGGSTYMIGGEEQIDINNIKLFEFKYSPVEVLDKATEWAEEHVKMRRKAFEDEYPWL